MTIPLGNVEIVRHEMSHTSDDNFFALLKKHRCVMFDVANKSYPENIMAGCRNDIDHRR